VLIFGIDPLKGKRSAGSRSFFRLQTQHLSNDAELQERSGHKVNAKEANFDRQPIVQKRKSIAAIAHNALQ
jgi:hypothetical protein